MQNSNDSRITNSNEYIGANVIFFDIVTKKPVAFFDTLKVSTIENEAETGEARGGQGNNKLMSWDYGRTANLTLSDALLSDTTVAMLAGQEAKVADVKVVGREQLTVGDAERGFETGTIELAETPLPLTVYIYKYENGLLGAEPVVEKGNDSIFASEELVGLTDGDEVMAFYEYTVADGKANQITFSGNNFPSTYRVVGDTFVRDEDGTDHVMQFEIPKAKMQSAFSLTMDVENVATFDFNLEVLMDARSKDKELYKLTRIDKK